MFRACIFCDFWHQDNHARGEGECRKECPGTDDLGNAYWPTTLDIKWCGEYKKRSDKFKCGTCKFMESERPSMKKAQWIRRCNINVKDVDYDDLCECWESKETGTQGQDRQGTSIEIQDQDPSCEDQCHCASRPTSKKEVN